MQVPTIMPNEGVVSWCGFAKEMGVELSSPKTEVEAIGSAAYVLPALRPGWSVMSLGKLKEVFDIPASLRISLKKYLKNFLRIRIKRNFLISFNIIYTNSKLNLNWSKNNFIKLPLTVLLVGIT